MKVKVRKHPVNLFLAGKGCSFQFFQYAYSFNDPAFFGQTKKVVTCPEFGMRLVLKSWLEVNAGVDLGNHGTHFEFRAGKIVFIIKSRFIGRT